MRQRTWNSATPGVLPDPRDDDLGAHLAQLQPRMTAVARRFAPSADVADDIVQNAFEKVLRNLDQFRGHARLSTWIHRIVVNEALMWLRSEKRRRGRLLEVESWEDSPWIDPGPDADQRLNERERVERLRAGVASLPSDDREVLTHCALGECSYQQYASRRGLAAAAVKTRAFRARRRLRGVLAEI